MLSDLQAFSSSGAVSLWKATQMLAVSAVYFGLLALLVKGTGALDAAKRARRETSVNLWLFVIDALLIAPIIAIVVRIIRVSIAGSPAGIWSSWALLSRKLSIRLSESEPVSSRSTASNRTRDSRCSKVLKWDWVIRREIDATRPGRVARRGA